MRLLLDTTYFLPTIGVSIKDLEKDALLKLIAKRQQISINEISIFELSAKGAKYVTTGALPAERVARGIRAIVYDEKIEIVPIYNSTLLLTAFKLRNMLNDFIDCLILSSAINQCDALVTEDSDILNLYKNEEFNELLSTMKPNFKIYKLNETL